MKNASVTHTNHENLPDYVLRTKKDMKLTNDDICQIAIILEIAYNAYKTRFDKSQFCKMYACAVLVTMKMYDDDVYNNKYFAHHLRMQLEILNKSEIVFLEMLNWNVFVSPQNYDKKCEQLKSLNGDYVKLIMHIFYPNLIKIPAIEPPKIAILQQKNITNYEQQEEHSFLFFLEIVSLYLFFD